MKRVEFRVQESEGIRIADQAALEGLTVAEFLRSAVFDRLHTSHRITADRQRAENLQALMVELRAEVSRLRTEARAERQAWRELLEESLQKNEAALRGFVLMLTESLGGHAPTRQTEATGQQPLRPPGVPSTPTTWRP